MPQVDIQTLFDLLKDSVGIEAAEKMIYEAIKDANLISNAVKFADKDPPRVEIGWSENEDFYEFYVKDNGPGIDEQYFDKIFGIFQRLGRREDYEGTGVGLTIAKKIVEIHNGKIWVESKVGEGATFYFTIPKKKGV